MGRGGMVTAEYLFSLGAGFLHKSIYTHTPRHSNHCLFSHRSDFSGAATIAECLLILSRAPLWREVVSQSVLAPLSTKAEVSPHSSSFHQSDYGTCAQEMDLSSIFALMVLAGFPKVRASRERCAVDVSPPTAAQRG